MTKRSLLFLFLWGSAHLIASATEINFNGFATVGTGITSKNGETLDGYDNNFGFKNKSLIALQASSDLGNGWGVTTQLLSRGSDDWKVDAEWAFVSYDASDEWRLLFGRQRAPFYMFSDYLDVSYTYPWITPPSGVYSLPFDVFDGVGSIYTSTIGDWDSTIHLSFGRNSDKVTLLGQERSPDFRDFFTATWSMNHDWLTVQASYARTIFSIPVSDLQPLLDGWRATPFANVADNIEIASDKGWFAGIGTQIDYNDFLVISEYTEVHPGNNVFGNQKSYYVLVGKRFGDKLIHVTYGADTSSLDDIVKGVPTGLDPGIDLLIASSLAVQSSNDEKSNFYTLGFRWDVDSSVAFKTEYTHFNDKKFGADANLFQMALVTVF